MLASGALLAFRTSSDLPSINLTLLCLHFLAKSHSHSSVIQVWKTSRMCKYFTLFTNEPRT